MKRKSITIIDLVAPDTVDERVLEHTENRRWLRALTRDRAAFMDLLGVE